MLHLVLGVVDLVVVVSSLVVVDVLLDFFFQVGRHGGGGWGWFGLVRGKLEGGHQAFDCGVRGVHWMSRVGGDE
jgi:hypothetical protein